jgi:hypothetical protein
MDWVQVYDPFGAPWLSTLMAAAPIVALLGLLVAGQSAPRAAISGLAVALVIAMAGFGMPASAALASAGYGACGVGRILVPPDGALGTVRDRQALGGRDFARPAHASPADRV